MRQVVLSIGALLTFGLLVVASHIAWQEFQRLAYLSRLDRWGEPARRASEVQTWQ